MIPSTTNTGVLHAFEPACSVLGMRRSTVIPPSELAHGGGRGEQAPGSVEERGAALSWTRIWNWGQPDQVAGHRPMPSASQRFPNPRAHWDHLGSKQKYHCLPPALRHSDSVAVGCELSVRTFESFLRGSSVQESLETRQKLIPGILFFQQPG